MWNLIQKLVEPALNIVDELVVDKDLAAKLHYELQTRLIRAANEVFKEQSRIIVAEAQSGSWITRSWRPIVMLCLTGCVMAHWFGFTPENLTPGDTEALLQLVQIGLGGYVVGRSAEQVAKAWKGKP